MPDDIIMADEQTVTQQAPATTSLAFDYSNGDESNSSQQQQNGQQNQQTSQQQPPKQNDSMGHPPALLHEEKISSSFIKGISTYSLFFVNLI